MAVGAVEHRGYGKAAIEVYVHRRKNSILRAKIAENVKLVAQMAK